MAKRDKKKRGWGQPRSNFSLTQFAVVALAGWLIWSKTDNWVVTILVGTIALLLVSADIFRELARVAIALIREAGRCYVAYTRSRQLMHGDLQRTARDRIRYGSRIELERARQDSFAMRSATRAHKQLGAGQANESPAELDEFADIEYRLV